MRGASWMNDGRCKHETNSVNMLLICSVAANGQRAAAFIHAQIGGIQRGFQQQREHNRGSNCQRVREYLCEPSAMADITSSQWLRLTVVSGFVEMKASNAVEKAAMKGHLIFGWKGKKFLRRHPCGNLPLRVLSVDSDGILTLTRLISFNVQNRPLLRSKHLMIHCFDLIL